jgi:thiosulfate/3-mercaptopyruvate sulfurtransferase
VSEKSPFVVSPEWLVKHLKDPGLSIVDGSWYLPAQNRDARAEYDAGAHSRRGFLRPGRRGRSRQRPAAHPALAVWSSSSMSAPWAFRATTPSSSMTGRACSPPSASGGCSVSWAQTRSSSSTAASTTGRRTAISSPTPTKIASTAFLPKFDASKVASFADMLKIVEDRSSQIADARPAGRFTGEEPEPRPGMRSGHMPGARSVP